MDSLAQLGLQLLEEHAEIALFIVLLLEESGIPLPLPGDLVMVFAGVRVAQGRSHFLVSFLLMESVGIRRTSDRGRFRCWMFRRRRR